MYPSHSSIAIHGLDDGSPIKRANVRQITPMTALVSGPTNAIQNSTFALSGFFSICETPPSAKRVISFTGSLFDVATSECASSCSSSETKNRMAVANRHGQDDAIAPLRDWWHGIARRVKRR